MGRDVQEFLVPAEWQVKGPKVTERGDVLAVSKSSYDALLKQVELMREALENSKQSFKSLSHPQNSLAFVAMASEAMVNNALEKLEQMRRGGDR